MDIQEMEDVINNTTKKNTFLEKSRTADMSDWSDDKSINAFHSKRPVQTSVIYHGQLNLKCVVFRVEPCDNY